MSDSPHKHRCLRCHQEFECQSPGICKAQYDVLPSIVTRGPDGAIRVEEHCPELAPKRA